MESITESANSTQSPEKPSEVSEGHDSTCNRCSKNLSVCSCMEVDSIDLSISKSVEDTASALAGGAVEESTENSTSASVSEQALASDATELPEESISEPISLPNDSNDEVVPKPIDDSSNASDFEETAPNDSTENVENDSSVKESTEDSTSAPVNKEANVTCAEDTATDDAEIAEIPTAEPAKDPLDDAIEAVANGAGEIRQRPITVPNNDTSEVVIVESANNTASTSGNTSMVIRKRPRPPGSDDVIFVQSVANINPYKKKRASLTSKLNYLMNLPPPPQLKFGPGIKPAIKVRKITSLQPSVAASAKNSNPNWYNLPTKGTPSSSYTLVSPVTLPSRPTTSTGQGVIRFVVPANQIRGARPILLRSPAPPRAILVQSPPKPRVITHEMGIQTDSDVSSSITELDDAIKKKEKFCKHLHVSNTVLQRRVRNLETKLVLKNKVLKEWRMILQAAQEHFGLESNQMEQNNSNSSDDDDDEGIRKDWSLALKGKRQTP